MNDKPDQYRVNLFKPKQGYMYDELRIIQLILSGWWLSTFGFQFVLSQLADAGMERFLVAPVFFNLPFHFWFTGQFLPLWFIILCVIFNIYIDNLTERHSRKRERFYD
jgi:putative solute:sodium symporter small subunit